MILKTFGLILCATVIFEPIAGSWFPHRSKRVPCNPDDDFTCKSGQCISSYNLCDGRKDCSDGSDETGCNPDIKCPINSFKCAYGACINMDKKCDRVQDCADGSDEYQEVCVDAGKLGGNCESDQFQCISGQCIDDFNTCDGIKDCKDGSDETKGLCSKKITSCPKNSFRCEYGGCIQLNLKCDGTIDCPDGSDEYSAMCFPNSCGKVNYKSKVITHIFSGYEADRGMYPWAVGLYSGNSREGWIYSCGGTLINPHLVLTAAHCVYNDKTSTINNLSQLKVGLGKTYVDWNANDEGSEKRDVQEIVVPPLYEGNITNYSQDIAIIDLSSSVKTSDVIMPVCLDWELKFQPKPGMSGTLGAWGRVAIDNPMPSNKLMAAYFPLIERKKCRDEIPRKLQKYLTHDKFCAGHTNGTGVNQGDSGSGLTFKGEDGLYRVFGVVSIGMSDSTTFSTFTNVSNVEHLKWLKENIQRLNEAHK